MLYRIVFASLLMSSFTVCTVVADDVPARPDDVPARPDDVPARRSVRVELKAQPEFIDNAGPNGQPERCQVDSVASVMPPDVATAVQEWTGISERGKTITVKFHTPQKALSFGDTGDFRAFVKVGDKVLANTDIRVRYKPVVATSEETTFFVLGIFEYENRVTDRKCYVICQIEGEKTASKEPQDAIIHPRGTASWIGPIVDGSSVLFPADADADK